MDTQNPQTRGLTLHAYTLSLTAFIAMLGTGSVPYMAQGLQHPPSIPRYTAPPAPSPMQTFQPPHVPSPPPRAETNLGMQMQHQMSQQIQTQQQFDQQFQTTRQISQQLQTTRQIGQQLDAPRQQLQSQRQLNDLLQTQRQVREQTQLQRELFQHLARQQEFQRRQLERQRERDTWLQQQFPHEIIRTLRARSPQRELTAVEQAMFDRARAELRNRK